MITSPASTASDSSLPSLSMASAHYFTTYPGLTLTDATLFVYVKRIYVLALPHYIVPAIE